jgi:CHAD domain-containing protein
LSDAGHGSIIRCMSFAIKSSDPSVTHALRRIARAELASALTILDTGAPGPDGVHGLRKHTKKLRGLLRLVRPVHPDFAVANATLRDGARHLAQLRDAEVRLATLRCLLADLPAAMADGPVCVALASLEAEIDTLRAPDTMQAATAALARDLRALRKAARRWTLCADGWAALEPGLARTWHQARSGLRAAARARARGGSAQPFHDWRKSVKNHWYQARLLAPVWPEMMAPQIAAADALGEDLGAHNDLDVLLTHLASHPDPAVAVLAHEGPLAQAAGRARADLARRSLDQGARLFVDRPGALARRWGGWWQAWQDGR